MQLRNGKIMASVRHSERFNPMAELKKVMEFENVVRTSTVDPEPYMKMHGKHAQQTPRTTIAVIEGLVNLAKTGNKLERMQKISLIYDIILADKTFRSYGSYANFIDIMCEQAVKHKEDINQGSIISALVTPELVAVHKHFECILDKYIDRSFGTPSDYDQYSYHYDIMKKIGYEYAGNKDAEISEYARQVDYDKFLIGDYIINEVTVYELYAIVTYNTFEALPNDISYDYCFNTVLSWF